MTDKWISKIKPDETEHKSAFAAELLKTPTEPFKAALAVFGNDTGKALYVATHWPVDSFVLSETSRLKEEQGELAFLPSKADLARSLWERAHGQNFRTSHDEFVKLTRLYAEIMDFVPKIQKDDSKTKLPTPIIASPLDEML